MTRTDTKKTPVLGQIVNIRAAAILLVVLGHSIILYSSGWNLYATVNEVPLLDRLKKIIDVIQMPLFFSISGYLFVYSHRKKRGFLQLVKNKVRRLLVPYFAVGFFYMAPIKWAVSYPGYQGKTPAAIALSFFTGTDVGHLWFLPALFLIFCISELLLRAAEGMPGAGRYAHIMLLAVSAVLYFEGDRIALGYAPLLTAFSNAVWFAAGYVICVYRAQIDRLFRHAASRWAGVAVLLLMTAACAFVEMPRPAVLCGQLLCLALIYAVMPQKSSAAAEVLSKDSFGVYLFHSPLIYITFAFFANANPVLVVVANLCLFGMLAVCLTRLVRRTKLRAVIGE